ncbi:type II toxin-antitoxin system PemK/MazF family toxin [Cellulomonas sp. APG4]|uniref:type II toxin-antitoxin system PemK/MazF family toxin n=1 Tax=Cellulomonas sp. APG4 TaxID=1538656 RepID=UPI00137A3A57|nr:type II toxin-antitoxin system PemK/MazF family toxin [Cellulomonas sp. APG4]NCT90206.1 type II toxin-antitoxin system PemK/MazF family toxin [Cellulomonas sp. APG4]
MNRLVARLVRTVRAHRAAATGRPSRGRPASAYPGDHTGPLRPVYRPDLDGDPDPGEIVWTWVPYEEDHGRGKDRPVLVVGHDGPWLLALMLSSRDHDARPDARGESWLDLGTGEWDARRRPSEVRLDRVLRIAPEEVRREGAVLDRARFDAVAAALTARHPRRDP